jgi:hypothetical protein
MLFRKDNKNNVENPAIKKGKANEKFNPSKKAHIIPKQNAGSIRRKGIPLKIFIG